MIQDKLTYALAEVLYLCEPAKSTEDQEDRKRRIHKLEKHQRGIIGYVIEAFAAHCSLLASAAGLDERLGHTIAVAEKYSVVVQDGEAYFCLPDFCLEEVGELIRGVASDIASLNWYAYNAARESILDFVEITTDSGYNLRHRAQTQELINEFEWRNIKKILSYTHLFDYPRPSDDRMGYLKNCGVDEIPLVLM